jgi:hypothetical protein
MLLPDYCMKEANLKKLKAEKSFTMNSRGRHLPKLSSDSP